MTKKDFILVADAIAQIYNEIPVEYAGRIEFEIKSAFIEACPNFNAQKFDEYLQGKTGKKRSEIKV